jgi:hypothetical protein
VFFEPRFVFASFFSSNFLRESTPVPPVPATHLVLVWQRSVSSRIVELEELLGSIKVMAMIGAD